MKILYHHRTQAEDAQGIHIHEMVSAFRSLGHEVVMTALAKPRRQAQAGLAGKSRRALTSKAPSWIYELLSLGYNFPGVLSLWRTIRSYRPDLIYERYSLNTFCGIWVSRHFGIPLILEVNAPLYHEQMSLGRLAFRRIARISERWICANSTKTIAVTGVLKQMLVREGVPPENVVVIHNGIDPLRFNPNLSGDSVRRRYGLDGKLVIGFVGWFRPWHRLDILLGAVKSALVSDNNVHALLVGDGPSHSQLYSYCAENGMLDSVTFSGPISREAIPAYIAAMDVTVQPSATGYACPMKIIEYMAMRKCILAPDQLNIKELVEDGRTAFLFRAADPVSFQSRLLELVSSPERRAELGMAAHRDLVHKELFWTSNAQRVLSFLPNADRGNMAPI